MASASGEAVAPLADIDPRLPANGTSCTLHLEYLVHCLESPTTRILLRILSRTVLRCAIPRLESSRYKDLQQ